MGKSLSAPSVCQLNGNDRELMINNSRSTMRNGLGIKGRINVDLPSYESSKGSFWRSVETSDIVQVQLEEELNTL